MFKYIVTAVAVLFASPASAQDDSICPAIGEYAGVVLENRYLGQVASHQLTILDGSVERGELHKLLRSIILLAYREPFPKTQTGRTEAIAHYRSMWELACYEVTTDYI